MSIFQEDTKLHWKIILAGILAVTAVGLFVWGDRVMENYAERGLASQDWPVAQGRVVHSQAKEEEAVNNDGDTYTYYEASIYYQYVVNNTLYTSNRIGWEDDGRRDSIQEAQELASSYPKGKMIPVHYDPEQPDFSLLDTTVPERPGDAGIGYFIASGAFLAFAIGLVYEQTGMFQQIPGCALIAAALVIFLGGGLLTAGLNVHFSALVGFGFVLFLVGGIERGRHQGTFSG